MLFGGKNFLFFSKKQKVFFSKCILQWNREKERKNYQLEPSIVVKDKSKNLEFFSSYIDLLDQIKYYGGLTNNHDRLFTGESYSFNGLFDFDIISYFNHILGTFLKGCISENDKKIYKFCQKIF